MTSRPSSSHPRSTQRSFLRTISRRGAGGASRPVEGSGGPAELEVPVNTVPPRHRRRHLATAGCLALIAFLAVGCGDDEGDPEAQETETVFVDADGNVIEDPTDGDGDGGDVADDSGPALTQDQLEVVVLTPENVGDGWTGGPVESDDDSVAPGCFGEI